MRLINLESHLFSTRKLSIEEKDLGSFIPYFLPLQIYPQAFNEASMNGEIKQQFMFVNPMDGKQVIFQDNKLSFVMSFGDKEHTPESLNDEHNKFLEFINTILSKMEEIRPEVKFNRLSYVIRYAKIEAFDDELNRLRNNTLSTLSWVQHDKQPTDFALNYGFRANCEDEEINNLSKITLGFFQNFTAIGALKQDCLIKEVDINSIDENRTDRFDYVKAKHLIQEFKSLSHEQAVALNSI